MDNNLIQVVNMDDDVNIYHPGDETPLDPLPKKEEFGSSVPTLKEHRTSGYTIYIDLPETDHEMLLVHGYLGHRIKVSRNVALFLRSKDDKRAPKPLYGEWKDPDYRKEMVARPAQEVIDLLIKKGFMTKRSREEELNFFREYATRRASRLINVAPSYLIMPTYSCNLRCPYCFQDHMRTDPNYSHLLAKMTKDTVDLIIDNIKNIEARHNFHADESYVRPFKFFGGEPLLEENKDIIEYVIKKAKTIGRARFKAISNGTDLHHYKDLLGPEGICEIQITLDGKPEEHDKRRIYPDGKGSFELIRENISMALGLGVKINVRVNVDKNNIDDLPELADVIVANGWDKYKNFGSYLAAIVAHNENTDGDECFGTHELNRDFRGLKERFPQLKVFHFDGDSMKRKARSIIENGKDSSFLSPLYCGAHSKMYVIDAFADLYACYEKTGDKKIRIGSIDKKTGLNINVANECNWRSRTVASNPVCSQCRYALFCGGGCAINAEVKTGKLHANFCDSYGKRFRESVAQAYTESCTE